jgi:hypothetical protein
MAKEIVEKKTKKGGHKKLFASVAVLIVLGVLIYLYEAYGSLPSSLASAVSSGQQLNSTVLEGALIQKVNSSKTFAVNYTGQIIIKKDPPISFSFAKYYNDTKVALSIENVSPFGNLSVMLISKNMSAQGTLCIKADPNSVFNEIASSNVTNGYKCIQTYNSSAQAQLFNIANNFVNVSSLSGVTTSSYGVRIYNGQLCYSVSGSGTISVNSTLVGGNSSAQTPANIDFSTCLSARYNIPLYVSANLTAANGSSIQISLDESSISQATSLDQVSSLP